MREYISRVDKYANKLRKNMTSEERHLWYDFLCHNEYHFRRQQPIDKYIADFYSAKLRLVIEIDGSQHFEENNLLYDLHRTEAFKKQDIKILRLTNEQIRQKFSDVCALIEQTIADILQGKAIAGMENDGHIF